MKRRDFLRNGSVLAGATFTPCFFAAATHAASELPPSDRIRMGAIGVGGRGHGNAREFTQMADVVAVCDVDEQYGLARVINAKRVGTLRAGKLTPPDTYKYYQKILERDDIDAVCIGTVDHWHVKIAIEALQAGKHVFCEKPLTLTIEENKLVRDACLHYNKQAFQVGTQQRNMKDLFMTATLMIKHGMLGKVYRATCDVGGGGRHEESIPVASVPAGLDWDLWHGQVPLVPYRATDQSDAKRKRPYASRCHGTFRYWYEYAAGTFTDWGAHHLDCALWALGRQEIGSGPVLVDATNAKHPCAFKNGMPLRDDCYNTSYEFDVKMKFADGVELRMVSSSPDGNGILFEGEKGRIHVNRERIKGGIYEENRPRFGEDEYCALHHGRKLMSHKANFMDAIRNGGLCSSDVFSHVLAMNVCHLSGISARLERPVHWDPAKEEIVGDEQAASFMKRERRKQYDIPVVRPD